MSKSHKTTIAELNAVLAGAQWEGISPRCTSKFVAIVSVRVEVTEEWDEPTRNDAIACLPMQEMIEADKGELVEVSDE